MTTHKITLRPSNEVIEVNENTNLLEALRSADVYIKSSCGGHATCSDCICKIVSGEDNLESPPFEELKLLGNVFHITKERLLCQTKVIGDVTIDISKHDKATDEVKLKSRSNKMQAKKPVTKVRTKDEYSKIRDERYQERLKNNQKDAAWEKHWEKNPESSKVTTGLGGGRRPKFFDTDKAIEATKQELLERDQKREFFREKDERDAARAARENNNSTTEQKENKDFKKFRKD